MANGLLALAKALRETIKDDIDGALFHLPILPKRPTASLYDALWYSLQALKGRFTGAPSLGEYSEADLQELLGSPRRDSVGDGIGGTLTTWREAHLTCLVSSLLRNPWCIGDQMPPQPWETSPIYFRRWCGYLIWDRSRQRHMEPNRFSHEDEIELGSMVGPYVVGEDVA